MRTYNFNINAEVDRYFDDSSLIKDESPRIVVFTGGPASGKTTIRKQKCSSGYVLVDAAAIFLSLSRGEFYPFPEAFEEPMQLIGGLVARRAIAEKRHIVTELIGAGLDPTLALFDAMRSRGYKLELYAVTCDVEEAQRRNMNRGDDNISCYYAEPYQRSWLLEAATNDRAFPTESISDNLRS